MTTGRLDALATHTSHADLRPRATTPSARLRRGATAAIALAIVWQAGTAAAQIPNASMHFGLFGGYHVFSEDADLRAGFTGNVSGGPDFGARIGFNFNWLVGTELQIEDAVGVSSLGGSVHATNFRALLVFHWLKSSRIALPYAVIGGGLYASFSDTLGDDIDYLITYGLGLKLLIADWVAFRLQVDHVIQGDGIDASLAHNFDITGGFDFIVLFTEPELPPPPPPPDHDGDGLLDAEDRCPYDAGAPALRGCPDADGDEIPDIDDECVTEKGPVLHHGCPDTDGDGLPDRIDLCPKQPGGAFQGGCPDTDGDGVSDDKDRCPLEPGVPELGGCPTPPEKPALERFQGVMRGITFDTGKATIRPESYTTLEEALVALQAWPLVQLIVEGHTDSVGSDSTNMALSQARADAVRVWFIQRGVTPDRLTAIGYGEMQPMADNSSSWGRAENRRIEFRIIQP